MYNSFPIAISIDRETLERIKELMRIRKLNRSALVRELVKEAAACEATQPQQEAS